MRAIKKTFWSLFLDTLRTNSKWVLSSALYNTWLVHDKLGSTWNLVIHRRSPLHFPLNESLLSISQYLWGSRKSAVGGERGKVVRTSALQVGYRNLMGQRDRDGGQLRDLPTQGSWSAGVPAPLLGTSAVHCCENHMMQASKRYDGSAEVLCKFNY